MDVIFFNDSNGINAASKHNSLRSANNIFTPTIFSLPIIDFKYCILAIEFESEMKSQLINLLLTAPPRT